MELGSLSLDFAASPLEESGGANSLGAALGFEPAVRPADRGDAIRLHDALAHAFAAAAARRPLAERDVATINSHASDELPAVRLAPNGSAARASTDPVRAALAAIARDAIETIAREREWLRVCAGDECGRVFLDRSRGKRRRWCSMQGCGNRAKVASFRRRAR